MVRGVGQSRPSTFSPPRDLATGGGGGEGTGIVGGSRGLCDWGVKSDLSEITTFFWEKYIFGKIDFFWENICQKFTTFLGTPGGVNVFARGGRTVEPPQPPRQFHPCQGGLEGVGPVPGGVKTDPPGGFFWELQGGSMCLPGGVEPPQPPRQFLPCMALG